jgi:hypothetical protein
MHHPFPVLTNSEVRKLLSDFSLIGRDLLTRGASKAADSLCTDQEALAHVDETAPQDQFVPEGGRKVGPTETSVAETKVPGMSHTVAQHPKEFFDASSLLILLSQGHYQVSEARRL